MRISIKALIKKNARRCSLHLRARMVLLHWWDFVCSKICGGFKLGPGGLPRVRGHWINFAAKALLFSAPLLNFPWFKIRAALDVGRHCIVMCPPTRHLSSAIGTALVTWDFFLKCRGAASRPSYPHESGEGTRSALHLGSANGTALWIAAAWWSGLVGFCLLKNVRGVQSGSGRPSQSPGSLESISSRKKICIFQIPELFLVCVIYSFQLCYAQCFFDCFIYSFRNRVMRRLFSLCSIQLSDRVMCICLACVMCSFLASFRAVV